MFTSKDSAMFSLGVRDATSLTPINEDNKQYIRGYYYGLGMRDAAHDAAPATIDRDYVRGYYDWQ